MSVISWNCHELSNPRIIHEIMGVVSKKLHAFIFLMETKVSRLHTETLKVKLGFDELFYIDSVGRSGGLALLWKDRNFAQLISYSCNHIDIEVSIPGSPSWRLIGFYGYPERSQIRKSWALLRELRDRSDFHWMVIGDFNKLLSHFEKCGGHPPPNPTYDQLSGGSS